MKLRTLWIVGASAALLASAAFFSQPAARAVTQEGSAKALAKETEDKA